jgi:hypothetical protein
VVEPGQERKADGIVEMYYETVADYKKAMAWVMTDAGKPIRDDGDKFTDLTKGGGFWVVEEHVAKDQLKKK